MESWYGRYKNVRDSVWRVLYDFNVSSLPVSVMALAQAMGVRVYSYTEGRELLDNLGMLWICETTEGFSTDVGYAMGVGGWYIFYDDAILPRGRIRFTLAHELGHILLGHVMSELPVGGYKARYTPENSDNPKEPEEIEADMFAARLLAPACVLWGLDIHGAESIASLCGLSNRAASIRAERMEELYRRQKFLVSPLERRVYEAFKGYIEKSKYEK